ncbi:MAG: diguanylate cyclase [Solirubrobacterales bacterium]|nr:diguanylate cyclase [Solirubrobacterales bacterium]
MKPRLRIAPKFLLLIVVLVPAMLASGWIGLQGLSAMRTTVNGITGDNLRVAQATAQLSRDVSRAEALALQSVIVTQPLPQAELDARLDDLAEPAVDADLATVMRLDVRDTFALDRLKTMSSAWRAFLALERTGRFDYAGPGVGYINQATASRVAALFSAMEQGTGLLVDKEVHDAGIARAKAASTQSHYRVLMLWVSLGALVGVLILVGWLIRDVVPRVTAYSAFARRVAEDDLSGRLQDHGSDELSGLGAALNRMVERAEESREMDARQREFAAAMQLAESEEEAQDLLRRHLTRVVPRTDPIVFVRNNSDDRLQAASTRELDTELAARLVDAKPRSCLAIRFAQAQHQGTGLDPLLECEVCGKRSGYSVCNPLIVHGEVIGSVLLSGPARTDDAARRRLRESIAHASPVIGNLRNLALAERRAATDSLTGLPNNRSAHDNLRRMVAQASRSGAPLAAGLLDIDHFKQLNDLHGHQKGDEVLALIGATLASTVRESDFVARYGGEEFLLLMPGTEAEGALVLAHKVCEAISSLIFRGLEGPVTASIGIAVFPEDASEPATLVRHADRALYAAKRGGRDRVERFAASAVTAAD